MSGYPPFLRVILIALRILIIKSLEKRKNIGFEITYPQYSAVPNEASGAGYPKKTGGPVITLDEV